MKLNLIFVLNVLCVICIAVSSKAAVIVADDNVELLVFQYDAMPL